VPTTARGCRATQAMTVQLTFSGSTAPIASVQVLTGDPSAGNTLADPNAIVPARSVLRGSGGVFSYQAPASSVSVVTLP
jgi:alpha-L-arabinofuranosidase